MNRSKCFSVVDYAHAAAHSATLAASYSGINKERSEHFALLAEEALNAGLEALFEARLGQAPSFLAAAAEIVAPAPGPHPIFADILSSHRRAA